MVCFDDFGFSEGSVAGQLDIKLLVASVHNLRVHLIFFDLMLFIS